MTIASTDWYEQIKDYIHRAVGQSLSVVEGTVTSRQLSPPSVKVMLQPYGVETGWLRIGTTYGGNGFGFLAIPPEGMTVKVIFDMGDKHSAVVIANVFNDEDTPPTLSDIDDVALVHSSGSQLYFSKNGDVNVQAQANLILNGGSADLARAGDPVQVSGTTSDGASFTATGTIQSGASNIKG